MNAIDPKDTPYNSSNEPKSVSAYEQGRAWQRQGYFWLGVVLALGVAVLVTPGHTVALAITNFAMLAAQIAALVRMCVCYRRARRIWAGVR